MTEPTAYEYATIIRSIIEAGLHGQLIVGTIEGKVRGFGTLLDDGTTICAEQFNDKWLGYPCSASGRPSPRQHDKKHPTATAALRAGYQEYLNTPT